MSNTMSLAVTGSSDVFNVSSADAYAIQTTWTGTVSGSLKLQISIDASIWTDLPGTTVTVSNSGDHVWVVETAPYNLVRIYYTSTSGSATLTWLPFTIPIEKI